MSSDQNKLLYFFAIRYKQKKNMGISRNANVKNSSTNANNIKIMRHLFQNNITLRGNVV